MKLPKRAFIVWWKDIDKWISPKHVFLSSNLPPGWSLVSVGDIVSQVLERVKVDHVKEYKMVGVRCYGEGTFHRETVKGNSLSATYVTPLVSNAFIYNRLFAWKESFAVVPKEHADCFVSNEFPQFVVNEERILPCYLYLFFMCNAIVKEVNKASIGSSAVSRNRFKEEDFLDFEIPLPPLPIQQAIVERWTKAKEEIKSKKDSTGDIQKSLEENLLNKIGVDLPPVTQRKGAFSLEWQDFERWDTFFYREDFIQLEKQLLSMKHAPLGKILNFISRTWKPSDFPDGVFEYVEISSVNKENGIFGSKIVNVNNAPSRATTLIKKGDFLISTTRPYLGAFAIVPDKYDNCVCSSGFALADKINIPEIDKDFLLFFLQCQAGLRQVERRMTGGLYPAIVQAELERVIVPLPPLEIQKVIMKEVKDGQHKIACESGAVARKTLEINTEIEELILGAKSIATS